MGRKFIEVIDEEKQELLVIPLDKIELFRLGFKDKNTLILEVNKRKIIIKEVELIKKVLEYLDISWIEEIKEAKEEIKEVKDENKNRSE